jgi:hypothetical protein
MRKQKPKVTAWIGVFAITGLLVPMADGCHKHSKVKSAQSAVVQLACHTITNAEALAKMRHAESQSDVPLFFSKHNSGLL